MKFKKIIYSSILLVIMISAGTGCNKNKFEINANPDDVTDVSVTPSVLLPGALQATATNIASEWWFISWWMGHGARSGSYQSFNEEETYKFTNDFHVAIWNQLYANANNYNIMINKAVEIGAGSYEGIGRIMKSLCFQMLVDTYGNIPYSEAFQGTAIPTPKYDKAVDIYNALFDDLKKATDLLSNATATDPAKNPDLATADLVYHGDLELWKKFANTLRLRLLVHLYNGSTVAGQTVAPGVNVATRVSQITSEGFLMPGESAELNPGFTGTKPQPYYRFFNTNEAGTGSQRDWARASEYAIGYYEWTFDPRIDRFYVAPSGGHLGIEFGTPAGAGVPIGSQLSTVRGPGLSPGGANSTAWILTATESLFLQAEARERGIITTGPSAKALLLAAIIESFESLGLDADLVTNPDPTIGYLAFNAGYPDVDYDAAPLAAGLPRGGLYTILSQKWFALNSISPQEIWTDYRRTGIIYGIGGGYLAGPTISKDPGTPAGAKIPVRLFYPQNEYNYNAANVSAEGTINVTTSRIFWDLN